MIFVGRTQINTARAAVCFCAIGAVLLSLGGCVSGGKSGRSGGSFFGAKGAPWTIRCLERTGPGRQTQIAQFAEALKRTPGIRARDVFTFSDSGKTGLYYGYYKRATDPKTGVRDMPRQMRRDLDLIKQLDDGKGRRYFIAALPARIPTPNVGNPAWNLNNVTGMYTLQVAAFEAADNFSEFKQAAADYCEFLRGKGYDAYYHHADASSVVTVGLFGSDAVADDSQGQTYLRQYSRQVAKLQQDELLKYNYVNGGIVYVIGPDGSRTPVPSFLVKLPNQKTP